MNATNTIQTLAAEASEHFEHAKRDNGTDYVRTKDGAPEWIKALCMAAHDDCGLLPDDWRYTMILDALNALAEAGDSELDDVTIEPPIYTHELLAWLASNGERVAICDEAAVEYGRSEDGILADISQGYWHEQSQVLYSVRASLAAQIEA